MDSKMSVECLPVEVLVKVISYLDQGSIDQLERVNLQFRDLITSSIQIWKQKINQFTQSDSQYKHVQTYSAYDSIKQSASSLRTFYQALANIKNNINKGVFAKKILNCLESVVNGRRVVQNEEWNRQHNYRGVYDMIFDQGRLCASVYDTIQIWDTRDYRMTHLFTKEILDQDKSQTTCFTLTKNLLMCGTENGYIKIIDIESEKVLSRARINSNYISDVKVKDDKLVALDWFGNITVWKVVNGTTLQYSTGEGTFEVPRLLQGRDIERLMDFGSDFLISTYKSHLTYYRDEKFLLSFPVYSDVFCIDIKGNLLGFGCKGEQRTENQTGFVAPVSGIVNFKYSPPRMVYFRTPDNDPVISLQLTPRYFFLGDVNGEIHIIDVECIEFNEAETFVDFGVEKNKTVSGCRMLTTLRSHDYRDFIWALRSDGFRILSGDETGRIIVHDFLAFNEKTEGSQQEDKVTEKDHSEDKVNDTNEEKSDSIGIDNTETVAENEKEATVKDNIEAHVDETVKDESKASINQNESKPQEAS